METSKSLSGEPESSSLRKPLPGPATRTNATINLPRVEAAAKWIAEAAASPRNSRCNVICQPPPCERISEEVTEKRGDEGKSKKRDVKRKFMDSRYSPPASNPRRDRQITHTTLLTHLVLKKHSSIIMLKVEGKS